MKYQIYASIFNKSKLKDLLKFGMEYVVECDDHIEASKIFDIENDASEFLIKIAEIFNEKHFGNKNDLYLMLREIDMNCLTLNGIKAFISEVEECYILRVKESGVELKTFKDLDDAKDELSTFEDIDIIEGNYSENYYEIYDVVTNKIIE